MAQSNLILEKYLQALEKDPSSRVFAPLAEYYRKNGLVNQAIDTLSTGIKYNPDYILGHLGLAFCYYDNGDLKRAYDILNPLVDANRDNIRMLKLFSDICLELKKNDQALEYLKYLLFINPKDSEAAEKVTLLEKENEKFGPIKFNIQDEITDDSTDILFDVDSMSSVPERASEVEEWVKVDLQSNDQSEEESFDEWSMDKNVEIPQVEEDKEEVREFKVQAPVEKVESTKTGDTPVITHTLVDLYCNQGYLDKAKDLLEKILELNPNDLKTKLKLQEVERVLSEAYLDDLEDSTEEVEKEQAPKTEKKFTEKSDRDQLMSLFDKTIEPEKAAPSKLKVVPTIEEPILDDSLAKVEEKLWSFHSALVARANQVLQR